MVFKYAYIFPILAAIWFPFTFLITYLIAVKNEDVPLVFPYISDTGNWSPESCFFAVMLNFGAVIMATIIYVRYRQVQYLGKITPFNDNIKNLNSKSFKLGIVATVGVSLVGDFQETNAFFIHVAAAGLAFGLGAVYQLMQCYISWEIYPTLGNKTVNIIRIIFAIISGVTFLPTSVCGGLALLQFKGDDMTKWKEADGGYKLHFISAVNEWILAFATVLFLGLFAGEFRKIEFAQPEITVNTIA